MARTTTGIDVGSYSNVYLRGKYEQNTFHVAEFGYAEHAAGEPAAAWSAAPPAFKPLAARIGLTGRNVNIRYTRVPRLPDWQLKKLMGFEVEEIGDQSGSAVASDFNVLPPLPEIEDEDVVLLGMARESLLDEHLAGLAAAGGKLDAFTPNALALYNAWLRYGVIEDDTVLVANVGHENIDVIVVRGPDLLFARNLGGGSKLFDDALAERFGVSPAKAGELKRKLVNLTPGAAPRDANQEKASRAAQAAAGQLSSLLQSTVMFCKSQIKLANLRLDKIVLCGGGAALTGLCEYLQNAINVPVELFDPFRMVETGALAPEDAELLQEHRHAAVIALGLATMASDPEAYSIEILPQAVRKKREFWSGPALALASAVLAVLFLVFDGVRGSRELRAAERDLARVSTQWSRAERTHKETEQLLAENAAARELALDLFALAGSGEQIARTLDAIQSGLPELFWIAQLSSEERAVEHLGVERAHPRPVVHLEGRAQEGATTVAEEFARFVEHLRAELPEARIAETLDLARNSFTLELSLFGAAAPADAASPAETGESATNGESAANGESAVNGASAEGGE